MNPQLKIKCLICDTEAHIISNHLKSHHPEVSIASYKEMYNGAAIHSDYALQQQQRIRDEKAASGNVIKFPKTLSSTVLPIYEAFGMRTRAAFEVGDGFHTITVFEPHEGHSDLVPAVDENYIFDPELLRNVSMGFELNFPVYLWGHAGTGKSSLLEQICAHTNRPYMRIQHTANTEECHITGQILANSAGTYFEAGPLALAMRYGFVYNADEYDFAHPSVVAIYQAVLEGKSLLIKEAPIEWRTVKPHKNFRFVATGNTNGTGDETGLYAGTTTGNAANYSRFGITEYVDYMKRTQEIKVISGQSHVATDVAELFVDFATAIRKAYKSSEITMTVGPREIIFMAKIGAARGGLWKEGIQLAYLNRLSEVDAEIVKAVMQRVFG